MRYFCAKCLERRHAAFQAVPGVELHEHFQHHQQRWQFPLFNKRADPAHTSAINQRAVSIADNPLLGRLMVCHRVFASLYFDNFWYGAVYMLFLPPSSSAFAIIKHHCFFEHNAF